MISLYSGTPGSGKSLHVASVIYKWQHIFKAPVICNFSFRAKACRPKGYGSFLYVRNDQLSPEFLIFFSEKYQSIRGWSQVPEEHILLVIDESQLLFNAREWQRSNRADWISFFTQHRKLGYKIILIAQFDRMLDRQIRSVLEYEYIHRKVKNIGLGGKVFNFLAGGGLHICVKVYKPLSEKVGKEFFKGNKRLYSLYDSYVRFNVTEPALDPGNKGTRKRVPAGQ